MYRVWNGLGPNGTDIELLVRAIGFSRITGDKDGVATWLESEGIFISSIEDSGPLPEMQLQHLGNVTKN